MDLNFKFEDIIDNYNSYIKSTEIKLHDYAEAARQALLNSTPDKIADNLEQYKLAQDRYRYFMDEHDRHKVNEYREKLRKAYNALDTIAGKLTWTLGKDNVLIEDDKIVFPIYGNLSFTAEMLSHMFEFKCGMFSFSSSFTCHEAYMIDSDWKFHIGYLDGDDSKCIIDFGMKKLAESPKAFDRGYY